jgi:membrane protease YdiL (CAAX protease family)
MTDTVHPVVGQVLADRPDSPAHPAAKRKATDGRRVLATLVSGVAAGAVGGTAVWFGFRWLAPSVAPSVITQVVVAVVYLTLIASLAISFRPAGQGPLDFRFTSVRVLGLACMAWVGFVAVALVVNLTISPLTGGLVEAAREIVRLATDAERLQGQPPLAWIIAIPRGCLIVPVFEEFLFRGVLPGWLRAHLSDRATFIAAAALFAVMHGYPIVFPSAFVFGLAAGWVRWRTGSTLNTVMMHALNNVTMLVSGLVLLR